MKALVTCGLVAAAIVATVAVAPVSSWVFQNQIGVVAQGSHQVYSLGDEGAGDQQLALLVPQNVLDFKSYSGKDPSERLTHALLNPDHRQGITELVQYTKENPKDALGWAVLARHICVMGGQAPDEQKVALPAYRQRTRDLFLVAKSACLKGEKLEPENAYFPLLAAALASDLGEPAEVAQALHRSAEKTTYDSHILNEALQMVRALELQHGYRGELAKAMMFGGVMLPEFAHITSLTKYLNRQGSLAEKRDEVQVASLMERYADTIIEFLVAERLVHEAIAPKGIGSDSRHDVSLDEWNRLAAAFDPKLAQVGIAPPTEGTVRVFKKLHELNQHGLDYVRNSDWPFRGSGVSQYMLPFIALIAILCTAILGALAWLFSRLSSERFRKMTPYFATLPAWFAYAVLAGHRSVEVDSGGLLMSIVLAVAGMSYLPDRWARASATASALILLLLLEGPWAASPLMGAALFFYIVSVVLIWFLKEEPRSKFGFVAGMIIAGISILQLIYSMVIHAPNYASFGIPGVVFFLTMGVTATKDRTQKPAVVMFLVFCGLISGFFCYEFLTGGSLGIALLSSLLFAGFTAMLFSGKPTSLAKTATCVGLVLFSVSYLVTVGLQVRGNKQVWMPSSKANSEGQTIRNLAKL